MIKKQLNKRLKELEIQDKKTIKKKCVKRLTVQATQKTVKEEKKKQKIVLKQLLLEAKQPKKGFIIKRNKLINQKQLF